ncbi:DUF3224 domain-containing protein [Brachybacterium sp. DNPG3]
MTITAAFTVSMTPAESVQAGTARFLLAKTWTGGIVGTSAGTMLTAGDPATGSAGYVAMEHLDVEIDGRRGTLVLQQFGAMADGEPDLTYAIAPGSGTGDLAGVTGTVTIVRIDDAGVHHVEVDLS